MKRLLFSKNQLVMVSIAIIMTVACLVGLAGRGPVQGASPADEPTLAELGLSAATVDDGLLFRVERNGVLMKWHGELAVALEDLTGTVIAETTERLGFDRELRLACDVEAIDNPRLYAVRYEYVDRSGAYYQGKVALSRLLPSLRLRVLGDDTWVPGSTAALRIVTLRSDADVPVADARVRVIAYSGPDEIELVNGLTDDAGTLDAEFTVPETAGSSIAIRVEADKGVAVASIEQDVAVAAAAKIYLTTDKPLYQPGQTILIRALALERVTRRGAAQATATIEVADPEGNKVFRQVGETDEFGIAAAEFTLADRINLGQYTVTVTVGNSVVEKTVTVDRYVLPKFDLRLTTGRQYYRPGETVEGDIRAAYFFGKPVIGQVVVSMGVFDVGFNEVARAEGETDEEGNFDFSLEIPERLVGQPLLQGDALLQFKVTVTDAADQKVEIIRTRTVSPDTLKVTIVPESGDPVPGIENTFYCLVAYPDGSPAPNATVRIEGTMSGDDPAGDGFTATLDTDDAGVAEFTAIPGRAMELAVTARDLQGHQVATTVTFNADDTPEALLLRPSASVLTVGETLRLVVQTARRTGYCYVDLVRDGQTVLTRSARLTDGRAVVETELTGDHEGTLLASAYIVGRDGVMIRDTRLLQVRGATDLSVAVRADHETYIPGQEVQLDFTVTDAHGRPVVAALGIAVVDEAVFALSEAAPGLARVFFAIEKELLEPRWEIHGITPGMLAREDADARSEVLLSAASVVAEPAVNRDSTEEDLRAVHDQLEAAVHTDVPPAFAAVAQWLTDKEIDISQPQSDELIKRGIFGVIEDDEDIIDPWGTDYRFTIENYMLTVTSAGPDGRFDSADDVVMTTRANWARHWRDRDNRWEEDEMVVDGVFMMERAARLGGGVAVANGFAMNEPMPPPATAMPGLQATGEDKSEAAAPVRVRDYFPETLFWEPALITDARGTAQLDFRVADSITDWRMAVTASSAAGQLGGLTESLRVFQDFFVDLNLPVYFTEGDEIAVPVAVYNYLDREQTVTLTLEAGDWFASQDGVTRQELKLGAGEVTSVYFPVKITGIGRHDFTIIARGESASDAVRRSVEVLPNGKQFVAARNGRLNGDEMATITIPANAIAGASELILKLYPGVFSQMVEGLEGIFRMPSGCFEQTTSTTYPNIIVLNYLRETGRSAPELELKAENYINIGYQRLLSFEVAGGGFEWFGNAPANQLLTAYGLQEFCDMAKVHNVDPALIERTARWLADRQQSDGSWEPDPHWFELLPDEIAGSGLMSSAFITWSLAESGQQPNAVAKGLRHINACLGEIDDAYTLAIAANAYAAAGEGNDRLFRKLIGMADIDDDVASWGSTRPTAVYGRGDAARLETTALAALALVRSRENPALAEKALNFLVNQKDSFGTWDTTQGTVLALKALTLASSGSFGGESDGRVTVIINGEEVNKVKIDHENADILRQVDLTNYLREGDDNVQLKISGDINMIYQLANKFYIPWDELPESERPAIDMNIEYDRTRLQVDDSIEVTVTAKYQGSGSAEMVILDVGVPPGFKVNTADLAGLVEEKLIQSYDITGRQLIIYVESIKHGTPCVLQFNMTATMPVAVSTPRSEAYLYYEPDVRDTVEPVEVEVE